ncbi:MAG: hypothetical protein Q4F00_13450, partial [bacterium]|nr:hypothetical protein [bacterium]
IYAFLFCNFKHFYFAINNQLNQQAKKDATQFITVIMNYLTVDNYNKVSEKYTTNNNLAKIINNPIVREDAKKLLEEANEETNENNITEFIITTIQVQFETLGLQNQNPSVNTSNSAPSGWNVVKLFDKQSPASIHMNKALICVGDLVDIRIPMKGKYNAATKRWQFDLLDLLNNVPVILNQVVNSHHNLELLTKGSYDAEAEKEREETYSKQTWLQRSLDK